MDWCPGDVNWLPIQSETTECNWIIDVWLLNIIEHQSNKKNLVNFWLFGIWTQSNNNKSQRVFDWNGPECWIYKLYLIFFDHYVYTQRAFAKKSNTIEQNKSIETRVCFGKVSIGQSGWIFIPRYLTIAQMNFYNFW